MVLCLIGQGCLGVKIKSPLPCRLWDEIRLDFSNVSTVARAGGGTAGFIRPLPFSCVSVCATRGYCICVCVSETPLPFDALMPASTSL